MSSKSPWIFRRGTLWSAELTQRTTGPVASYVPAEFRQVQPASIPQLVATARQMDPIVPGALARRFEIGRRCFAAWVDGSIAAYGWLTHGPEWVGEFERELHVPDGEAYIWDCATLPRYRRQRLFSALLGYVTDQLRREGLRRLWIIGLVVAPSIVRSVEAAGFEPVLRLAYLRLLDKRILLTAPVRNIPPQHLSAARRLLKTGHERAYGPLIVGNSARPRPPDTHFDR